MADRNSTKGFIAKVVEFLDVGNLDPVSGYEVAGAILKMDTGNKSFDKTRKTLFRGNYLDYFEITEVEFKNLMKI